MNTPRQQLSQLGFRFVALLMLVSTGYYAIHLTWDRMQISKDTDRQKMCQRNMRNMYEALRLYAQDHDDVFPPTVQADATSSGCKAVDGWSSGGIYETRPLHCTP